MPLDTVSTVVRLAQLSGLYRELAETSETKVDEASPLVLHNVQALLNSNRKDSTSI